MNITETRIKLLDEANLPNRLLAFGAITLDAMIVIRDLKVIHGHQGLFVAMPSRKLTDRCGCGYKNHLLARFCNQCGHRLLDFRERRDPSVKPRLHSDVAHPINRQARDYVHQIVLKAYYDEVELAKQPGYRCRYDLADAGDEASDLYAGYQNLGQSYPGGPRPVKSCSELL